MNISVARIRDRNPNDIETRAKIFNVFYQAKPCVQCNQCCKNEGVEFVIAMDFNEHSKLEKACKTKKANESIRPVRGKSLPVLGFREQCGFLDEGHCEIYEQRPGICRTYPIMPTRDEKFWFLDNACPAVNKLEIMGVDYLYTRDIICKLEELTGFIQLYPPKVQNSYLVAQRTGALASSFLSIPLLYNAIIAANELIGNNYPIFSEVLFRISNHNGELFLPVGGYIKSD